MIGKINFFLLVMMETFVKVCYAIISVQTNAGRLLVATLAMKTLSYTSTLLLGAEMSLFIFNIVYRSELS